MHAQYCYKTQKFVLCIVSMVAVLCNYVTFLCIPENRKQPAHSRKLHIPQAGELAELIFELIFLFVTVLDVSLSPGEPGEWVNTAEKPTAVVDSSEF